MSKNPFRYFKTSPEIIQPGVLIYVRFPLSLRNVEDLLDERSIDICHESVRLWVDRFGTYFAHKIRKCQSESMRRSPQWRWHLDEVFVKIRGERHDLWRAVDHERDVLESYVTKKRVKTAALKFLKKAMKRYGNPHIVVTDRCPSYQAAMKVIGSEVCKNSFQSIRQCTAASTSKGISTPESGSNKNETPLFANGATFLPPRTCSSANIGYGFALD